MKARPGSAARALLGGDERLHVFVSEADAEDYRARIPGARTYAPRKDGWACVLHDAITGVVRAKDIPVDIEWDRKKHPRSGHIVLEVAVVLYDKGATEVRINGGVVRMPERTQVWRGR